MKYPEFIKKQDAIKKRRPAKHKIPFVLYRQALFMACTNGSRIVYAVLKLGNSAPHIFNSGLNNHCPTIQK